MRTIIYAHPLSQAGFSSDPLIAGPVPTMRFTMRSFPPCLPGTYLAGSSQNSASS
jgi:hypothetical protein